ncbi:MAG: tripartite tricarboxylate transporter substrate binding protein, partial [Burkholderiales bacterium]
MKRPWRRLLRCGLLTGLIGLGTIGSAQAQWPDHPIRFVVPFTPGGGTDAVSRNLADKLARETHWNFV